MEFNPSRRKVLFTGAALAGATVLAAPSAFAKEASRIDLHVSQPLAGGAFLGDAINDMTLQTPLVIAAAKVTPRGRKAAKVTRAGLWVLPFEGLHDALRDNDVIKNALRGADAPYQSTDAMADFHILRAAQQAESDATNAAVARALYRDKELAARTPDAALRSVNQASMIKALLIYAYWRATQDDICGTSGSLVMPAKAKWMHPDAVMSPWKAGSKVAITNVINNIMYKSGCDAALALLEHLGGALVKQDAFDAQAMFDRLAARGINAQPRTDEWVPYWAGMEYMNQISDELDMQQTRSCNPHGMRAAQTYMNKKRDPMPDDLNNRTCWLDTMKLLNALNDDVRPWFKKLTSVSGLPLANAHEKTGNNDDAGRCVMIEGDASPCLGEQENHISIPVGLVTMGAGAPDIRAKVTREAFSAMRPAIVARAGVLQPTLMPTQPVATPTPALPLETLDAL